MARGVPRYSSAASGAAAVLRSRAVVICGRQAATRGSSRWPAAPVAAAIAGVAGAASVALADDGASAAAAGAAPSDAAPVLPCTRVVEWLRPKLKALRDVRPSLRSHAPIEVIPLVDSPDGCTLRLRVPAGAPLFPLVVTALRAFPGAELHSAEPSECRREGDRLSDLMIASFACAQTR
jgi:hypothetical protein